ncbi:MAG: hypothetical protein ACI4R9_00720 [Kiritimatiellia bacterium]
MKKLASALTALALFVSPAWAEDDDEDEAPGPDPRPFVSIDAEHIENKTDDKRANFSSLIDRLNNALTETGLWRVMDMKDMADALKKNDQLALAANAKKIDDFETPAWMLKLAITTYGVASATSQNALTGNTTRHEQGKVELVLRVVDQKGETLKSKNISGQSYGNAAAAANLKEQVLQDASKKACNLIVAALIEMTPFYISDVEDGLVNVDIGKPTVGIGQVLRVMKQSKGKKSKRTGKVTRSEKEVARLQIVSATDEISQAKVIGGEIVPGDDEDDPYKKYVVRFVDPVQDAMNTPPPPPAAAPESDGAAPF